MRCSWLGMGLGGWPGSPREILGLVPAHCDHRGTRTPQTALEQQSHVPVTHRRCCPGIGHPTQSHHGDTGGTWSRACWPFPISPGMRMCSPQEELHPGASPASSSFYASPQHLGHFLLSNFQCPWSHEKISPWSCPIFLH